MKSMKSLSVLLPENQRYKIQQEKNRGWVLELLVLAASVIPLIMLLWK